MAAELNPATPPARSLPPGYVFDPEDSQLIQHYLMKKINNEPLPLSGLMHDVNLYQYNPQTLAESYPKLGEKWYFFTPREKKYKNGSRPNRAAGTGFWKATGANKSILLEDETTVVGYKNVLAFYEGRPPNGDKTNWIMHEYTVYQHQPSENNRNADGMKLDDWVLCRIYKKDTKVERNNKKKATASTLVDKNNPPESIKVDVAQVANNENLAQTSNFLKVGGGGSDCNDNCNFGPIVTYDNNAIPVATDNNVNLGVIPNETTGVEDDVNLLFEYLTNNIHNAPTFQNVLHHQNVPEVSSSHISPRVNWMESPFRQPLNVSEPPFFDVEGWGIQSGDFPVQLDDSWQRQHSDNPTQRVPSIVDFWRTQNSSNLPRTGPSNVGFSERQNSNDPPQIGPFNVGFWGTQNSSNPPEMGPSNVGFWKTQNSNNPPQ